MAIVLSNAAEAADMNHGIHRIHGSRQNDFVADTNVRLAPSDGSEAAIIKNLVAMKNYFASQLFCHNLFAEKEYPSPADRLKPELHTSQSTGERVCSPRFSVPGTLGKP
jgi:hypothetical protein